MVRIESKPSKRGCERPILARLIYWGGGEGVLGRVDTLGWVGGGSLGRVDTLGDG